MAANNNRCAKHKSADQRSSPQAFAKQTPSTKQTPLINARIAAVNIITKLLKQEGSLASLLPQYLPRLNEQEGRFLKELCYGCCRWHSHWETILKQLLKQPLRKKDSDIKAILYLGLYQLQMLNTAPYAAINESVNVAAKVKKTWAKKLINAVLRNFQRNQKTLYEQAKAAQPTAHPHWLEVAITTDWPSQAADIFAHNNQHPPLTLRVNTQKISRSNYLLELEKNVIPAVAAPYSSAGIYLSSPITVTQLPGFAQGHISVQDEAAQLAASLLELQAGQRVLDACCAPGGKTCHIAESEPQLTQLVAVDLEQRRLTRVHDNLDRLNLRAQVICADVGNPHLWWDGEPFDRILLDAPCSATGIIRRQPDIKLLRQQEHVDHLIQLQQQLLQALWPLLNEGGILLYATCSILARENSQVIEQFMQENKTARHEAIVADWGHSQQYGRQLFPRANGHDGFYYAKLRKVNAI